MLWKLLLGWALVLVMLAGLQSIDQPWHKWARLAWREMRMHAKVAGAIWLLTATVAGIARAMSDNMNQRAIAKRMRKRRKQIARMMGE